MGLFASLRGCLSPLRFAWLTLGVVDSFVFGSFVLGLFGIGFGFGLVDSFWDCLPHFGVWLTRFWVCLIGLGVVWVNLGLLDSFVFGSFVLGSFVLFLGSVSSVLVLIRSIWGCSTCLCLVRSFWVRLAWFGVCLTQQFGFWLTRFEGLRFIFCILLT